jgi:hypothetical protein
MVISARQVANHNDRILTGPQDSDVIVGWLIMQAGEVMGPALHLPEWVNSTLAFFLILGFPLAMLFAWAFEMTPEGLKKEEDIDRSQSPVTFWAFAIAKTYAWAGDPDKAFDWLDIAYAQKDAYMAQLIYNPWLANLHDDPRWEKILEKMELLKYWEKSQARLEEAE